MMPHNFEQILLYAGVLIMLPLLPLGKFDDREVFDWLIHHKNSYVKVLTDDNFERVTQAASGATTGDWFVLL